MPQKAKALRQARQERQRRIRNSPDKRLRVVARLRRILGVVLLASVVLTITINSANFSAATVSELIGYFWAGLAEAEDGTKIRYQSQNAVSARAFQQGVVTVDNDAMIVQNPGGVRLEQTLGYSSPMVVVSERYALAYDKNGNQAALVSHVASASTQKTEASILTACVGETGDYALITNESGYKTAVTVYTSGGKQRFKWASPDYYFTSCAISPDGTMLAITSFGADEQANLEGKLFLRDLNSENSVQEISLDSTVPLTVSFLDNSTVGVVGDYTTSIISSRGKVIDTISYSIDDLKGYCFGGGSLVLAVHSYSGTSRAELCFLDSDGRREQILEVMEDLQAIDYDGARIALLTSSGLTVYSDALRPLWQNETAVGAQSINLTEDGGVWLLYSKQAEHISAASDTSEELKS